MTTKKCKGCRKTLDESQFKKSARSADGLAIRCLSCAEAHAAHGRKRYNEDPEIRRTKAEYEEANRERRTEYARNQYQSRLEVRKTKSKYAIKNRQRKTEFERERYQNEPEVRKAKTEYKMELYRTDPKYRADHNFSAQIRQSLNKGKSGQAWEAMVGYTLDDLLAHLETQFEEGMTWDNYGEWHIDHRVPRSWFIYESAEDPAFKECWALPNLQPKWGKENISKGNRFSD